MSCFGYYWDEFLGLGKLALPTLVVNGLEISMGIIDLIFLGHVSPVALSIGALGGVYYNMIWYFSEGILSAQDSLISHALEMKDQAASRHWSYVSAVVLGGITLIGTILFLLSPLIIQLVFQVGDDLKTSTSEYIITLIPALWSHAGYRIIQKYLNCQYIITPIIATMITGVCVKLFLNTILVNVAGVGFIGTAISTSVTRGIMFIIIFVWFASREGFLMSVLFLPFPLLLLIGPVSSSLRNEFLTILSRESQELFQTLANSKGSSTSSSSESQRNLEMTSMRSQHSPVAEIGEDEDDPLDEDTASLLHNDGESFNPSLPTSGASSGSSSRGRWRNHFQIDCLRFLALGLPGAIVLVIEMWSYDVALIVMSQIGPVSISTQQILICWTNVSFILFPLSFSIAASIRLNRLLISQNYRAAKTSALITLLTSALFAILSGLLLYELKLLLGSLFTSDQNIIRRVRQLAPIVAIFQLVNGLQGGAQGVMRGMGRQTELVGYLFVSYWIIAMPLGLYLAFYTRPRVGIVGIWYGYLTGLGLLCLILLMIILTTDWEREVRRSRLRYEKYQRQSMGGDGGGGALPVLQSVGFIGSRALGGFLLMSALTDEEELDDIERIEVVLPEEGQAVGMEALQEEASRRHQL